MDAHYFTSPGVAAFERVLLAEASGRVLSSARVADVARVWDPARFARAYAAPLEPGLPYLRPYDVFDYLPTTRDRLSLARNEDVELLRPSPGTLLQTCSGRNLGPVTIADDYLASFALSHDMVRLEVSDEEERLYLLAFLRTPTGQALLRRGKSGSVIDHITTAEVEAVPLPRLPEAIRTRVVEDMRLSVAATARARASLRDLLASQAAILPAPPPVDGRTGWVVHASKLADRLDSAFYSPQVQEARRQATDAGGVRLAELASALVPTRYRRFYVAPGFGRPVLSGGQLLQHEPVNLRFVSDRSFRDPSSYVVREGMTIMAADGRAQGGQGSAALVTADRDGWLASEHVMRLTPRAGVSPGLVWLSLATVQARLQVNALSFGSVIDELNAADVEAVVVPPVASELVPQAEAAWADFALGSRSAAQAVATFEDALES